VLEFTEKPGHGARTDEISAGAYVLDRAVVDPIPAGEAVSIERQVFPRLVGQGLHGVLLEGYWADIGTPDRYLQASWDILEGRVKTGVRSRLDGAGLVVEDGEGISPAAEVRPPALVEREVTALERAAIGPRAVVGRGSRIGEGAILSSSVVFRDCEIGAGATLEAAILAAGVEVGEGARLSEGTVVGEGARISHGAVVPDGTRVAPDEVYG
jgi:mannose-1-phosphate guanylyltransferase